MQHGQEHQQLRQLLFDTFKDKPHPTLIEPYATTPAASIWSCARIWISHFRGLDLTPGSRIALQLPHSRANLAATIAAWWERLTLCPVPPDADPDEVLSSLDARAIINNTPHPAAVTPDAQGNPNTRVHTAPRQPLHNPTPNSALILATSGSSENLPKRVVISHANLLSQITSHAQRLTHKPDDIALSALPWHQSFGLLVDLWPALLNGATVITNPDLPRDPEAIIRAVRSFRGPTARLHLSLVPLQVQRIAQNPAGQEALNALAGGVVGGAPIDHHNAAVLQHTNLRAGYGLTEASPGVTLGQPGQWTPNLLGKPINCSVSLVNDEITVSGPNVSHGLWSSEHGFRPRDRRTPLRTGDLAEHSPLGLIFKGRQDHRFKLPNGRMIDTPAIEAAIANHLRTRHDSADTPVVLKAPPNNIAVAILSNANAAETPDILRAIPQLSTLVSDVRTLQDTPALRTPKGEPNRRAIAHALAAPEPVRLAA